MLQNWLSPLALQNIIDLKALPVNALGKKISLYQETIPNLTGIHVAIIGIGTSTADTVRQQLYPLMHRFSGLKIVDLGNIRNEENAFLIPLVKELLDSKIIPILIGDKAVTAQAQYQAHYAKKQLTNFVVVDEKVSLDLDSNAKHYYLNSILKTRKLFNFGILGYQLHFTPPVITTHLDKRYFDHLRLGQVRASMEQAEPIIRDADLLSFNLAAIRQADAPGQEHASPNGFFSEEACQLSRYAGMSDKLTSIGFYGFQIHKDRDQQTAQLVAQLVWYFLDGLSNRKNDFPVSTDGMVEYIVNSKQFEYQLTFWKSAKSDRWWMQIPIKTRKKHERHRLIPCAYADYQLACKDELPDRLFNAFHKFK